MWLVVAELKWTINTFLYWKVFQKTANFFYSWQLIKFPNNDLSVQNLTKTKAFGCDCDYWLPEYPFWSTLYTKSPTNYYQNSPVFWNTLYMRFIERGRYQIFKFKVAFKNRNTNISKQSFCPTSVPRFVLRWREWKYFSISSLKCIAKNISFNNWAKFIKSLFC